MTALLGLRNLSKRFGYRTILQELNLDIRAGECVLLLGNNGAGKSTL
ncbi:MAG: ATP-binding cassette domain-containing protein, partial [bacterium]